MSNQDEQPPASATAEQPSHTTSESPNIQLPDSSTSPFTSPPLNMPFATSFAEKAMGPFAKHLIQSSGIQAPNDTKPITILDQMCGFGILTAHLRQYLLTDALKGRVDVVASDISQPIINAMTSRIDREGWTNFSARTSDATASDFESERFEYILCNFGPSVVPKPHDVLRECFRILKPGGTFAFTTWVGTGWTGEARELFKEIDGVPEFPREEEYFQLFAPGEWHVEGYVHEACRKAGFQDVGIEEVRNTTRISVEEFLGVFPISTGMVLEKAWSSEEKETVGPGLYQRVSEVLRTKYGEGGVMVWDDWRALVVVCKKP